MKVVGRHNKFQICIDLDITMTKDVLNDYYGITIPDEYLVHAVIMRNGQILGEIIDNSISDTCARELLITAVIRSLPNSDGKEWPMYSTSEIERKKFFSWFTDAIEKIGGNVRE